MIGTMIETPRAAIRADEIAEEADFFSFGTNDLTQMTFGFSRDDVESRMMPAYLEQGLLKRNPFETIDRGRRRRARAHRRRSGAARPSPDLKLGVCGEHGGDPESIALFYDAGLDYVSLLAVPGPIARLAVGPGGRSVPAGATPAERRDVSSTLHSLALCGDVGSRELRRLRRRTLGSGPRSSAFITLLLIVDLLVVHREAARDPLKEAAIESAVWISIGLAFRLVIVGDARPAAAR